MISLAHSVFVSRTVWNAATSDVCSVTTNCRRIRPPAPESSAGYSQDPSGKQTFPHPASRSRGKAGTVPRTVKAYVWQCARIMGSSSTFLIPASAAGLPLPTRRAVGTTRKAVQADQCDKKSVKTPCRSASVGKTGSLPVFAAPFPSAPFRRTHPSPVPVPAENP